MYGSTFDQSDVIGHKATEFGEIMQNNGYYAIQDHSWSPLLVQIENPYATSLCEQQFFSHRFQDMLNYWSNIGCRQGVERTPFNALIRDVIARPKNFFKYKNLKKFRFTSCANVH